MTALKGPGAAPCRALPGRACGSGTRTRRSASTAPFCEALALPRLAAFYGIVVWMYRPDHPPRHFHAEYGEFGANGVYNTGRACSCGTVFYHRSNYWSCRLSHDAARV